MTKFRKGDVVSLTATVSHDYDEADEKRVFVKVDGEFRDLWLPPDALTMVRPLFEVNDSVTWKDYETSPACHGTILAIQDGHAWISHGDGNYCTRLLTAITRVFHEEIPT